MKLAATFTLLAPTAQALYGGSAMTFEEWLKGKGIDASTLDEARKTELLAEFEKEGKADGGASQGASAPAKQPEAPKGEAPVKAAAVTPPARSLVASAKEEAENAIGAERERVAAIQDVCSGEFPRIERDAIRLGWTVEDTSQKVLKAMRENRPQANVSVAASRDRGREYDTKTSRRPSAFVQESRTRRSSRCTASRSSKAPGASGHEPPAALRGMRPHGRRHRPAHVLERHHQAAFSTVSLPGILNNVANKKLLRSFEAQPIIATRICSQGELNDFKESERYRMTDVGDIEQVAPDGELKHGGLAEEKATNQLGTFGKIFTLTRQMIYNDDLGAFLKVPRAWARGRPGRLTSSSSPACSRTRGASSQPHTATTRKALTPPFRQTVWSLRSRCSWIRRIGTDSPSTSARSSCWCRRPEDVGAGAPELHLVHRNGQHGQAPHPDL